METKKLLSINVILFLSFATWWAFSGLWVIDPTTTEDYGMAILYGLLSAPISPFAYFVAQWLDAHTFNYNLYYYYTLFGLASYLKFFIVILLSTISFGIGFICASIVAQAERKFSRIKPGPQYFKKLAWLFFKANLLFILIYSGIIFVQQPPVPFASLKSVIASCSTYSECHHNIIAATYKNCQNQSVPYIYPLKQDLPLLDTCVLESVIENNFYKDNVFANEIDTVTDVFSSALQQSNRDTITTFCNSLNNEHQGASGNVTNREFCYQKFDVAQADIDEKFCFFVLTKNVFTKSDNQLQCVLGFVPYPLFDVDVSTLNKYFAVNGEGSLKIFKKDSDGFRYFVRIFDKMNEYDWIDIDHAAINSQYARKELRELEEVGKVFLDDGRKLVRLKTESVSLSDTSYVVLDYRNFSVKQQSNDYIVAHVITEQTYTQIETSRIKNLPLTDSRQMLIEIAEQITR